MAGASDGDSTLLHRLKKCGLGAGCGAVDLISEDELGENGPLLEFKLPSTVFVFNEERCACDVGGHHIRRELDTLEGEIECLAEGINQLRFP